MEEKEMNGEDENLNSNNANAWENQEDSKKVFTLEEVEAMKKEMQSNSEKWVQKILWEQKLYKQSLKELSNIWQDAKRLVEIAEDNPRLAEIILEEYFDGESLEEYKERIWYTEDYTDPKIIQNKIKKEAEKLAENNLIQTQKQNFIDKLQMSDEEKKSFEEAFEELKQLKSFNTKDLTKQFEKAYRLSNDNDEALKKLKSQEVIAKAMATWEGKSSNWQKQDKNTIESQIERFKKKHKL